MKKSRRKIRNPVRIKDGKASPLKPRVHKGDHLCWANQDANKWIVTFLGGSPLQGKPKYVEVPAGAPSRWHKVAAVVPLNSAKAFRYRLKKRKTDPDPPPDGPGVIVDG